MNIGSCVNVQHKEEVRKKNVLDLYRRALITSDEAVRLLTESARQDILRSAFRDFDELLCSTDRDEFARKSSKLLVAMRSTYDEISKLAYCYLNENKTSVCLDDQSSDCPDEFINVVKAQKKLDEELKSSKFKQEWECVKKFLNSSEYVLVRIGDDRRIWREIYNTYEEARKAMLNEMRVYANVPIWLFDLNLEENEYQSSEGDFWYTKDNAYSDYYGKQYDWLIFRTK